MTEDAVTRHPDELLQELLDARLDAEEKAEVEAHIAGCERCRRLRDTLVASRRLLRETTAETAPEGLRRAVEETLAVARTHRSRRGLWLAAAAALVVVATGVSLWLRPQRAADPIAELVRLQSTAEPTIVNPDAIQLERQLEGRVGFRPRVLDLAMMNIRLTGGGSATVAGRTTAWTAYEGPTGRLLCAMFRGRLEELPSPDQVRRRAPFTFRVYDRGAITVVAWQEGELVCVLVGGGGREAVIELAMAKAMLRT